MLLAAVEPALTGDGPELYGLIHELGCCAEDLMHESRRVHRGRVLYPLSWVSHHWEQMTAVFAELDDFPSQQVFNSVVQ